MAVEFDVLVGKLVGKLEEFKRLLLPVLGDLEKDQMLLGVAITKYQPDA